MQLNDLKPAPGSRKARVRLGRGMGSGLGKTCGFGHKGQKARSGRSHRAGFEGGQTPLYRRLPKLGFNSALQNSRAQVSLTSLEHSGLDNIGAQELRESGLIPKGAKKVKIILSGSISRPLTVAADVLVTAGARVAIQTAGGKIELSNSKSQRLKV